MSRSKSELVEAIARELGVEAPRMSTGSTEPKTIFLLANESLGLRLSETFTKPELAKAIVESAGKSWTTTCESRGGTVMAEGLQSVLDTVRFFLGREP